MASPLLRAGLLAGLLAPPTFAGPLFGPAPVTLTIEDSPIGVGNADLNADGALDLVVLNFGADSVSILLGDGLGSFDRTTQDIVVGDRPRAVAITDLDGDSVLDLAVCNFGEDSVSILLGDGQGGFRIVEEILVGSRPISIAVNDFNADGAPDFAVVNRNDNNVGIYFGNGLGNFLLDQQIPVGTFPQSVALGDFDSDGNVDLSVANRLSNTVSILLGNGTGGFAAGPQVVSVADGPVAVAVGDLDGDGDEDLAVARLDGQAVSILLGDGLGDFVETPDEIAVGNLPVSVALADFNGDGNADLSAVNRFDGTVSILLGNGTGDFSRSTDITVGASPRSVTLGDFDRDGAKDLAVSNHDDDSISILLGDGIGDFSRTTDFAVGPSPEGVAVGDFNGDATDDLAVCNAGDDSVGILLGDGGGGFLPASFVPVGQAPQSVAVSDFDGDGKPDLVVANLGSGSVSILFGDGEGSFPASDTIDVGLEPRSVAVGDFDGDEDNDVVVANGSANQFEATVSILLGNGQGNFERLDDVTVGGLESEPFFVVVHDLNNDGHADLAVVKRGSDSVAILRGDGLGGFEQLPDVMLGGLSEPTSLAVEDFDDDGQADLAVANSGGTSVSVFLGDGSGQFPRVFEAETGDKPYSLAAGDFNEDGFLDLAVSDLDDELVSILLGDGLGGFSRVFEAVAVGPFPVSVAAGDFDGDSSADLAVVHEFSADPTRDAVTILFNQLRSRADVNGSNRIDGFDVGFLGRLFALRAGENVCSGNQTQTCTDDLDCPLGENCLAYRRNVDVNLDGMIDGSDLAFIAARFGDLNGAASPLRATLSDTVTADPGTITIQPVEAESEGDRLVVEIRVHDNGFPAVAVAEFVLTFIPVDIDQNPVQVLEVLGSETGNYLEGGATTFYLRDTNTPGRVRVVVSRIPNLNRSGAGEFALLNLIFRAKRAGNVMLQFDRAAEPRLLNQGGGVEVGGSAFVDGGLVTVSAPAGGPPGQKVGFAPDSLDFGQVEPGASSRKTLRISNFGFSDLTICSATGTLPTFTSFLSASVTVPPFGSIELPVVFSPTEVGLFAGELVVDSDDPQRPAVRVPVLGRSGLALAVTPVRLDFGRVAPGEGKSLQVKLKNRGNAALTLTNLQPTVGQFVAQADFSILDPDQRGTINVTFQPTAEGEFEGFLTLVFDAPDEKRVAIGLTGATPAVPPSGPIVCPQ